MFRVLSGALWSNAEGTIKKLMELTGLRKVHKKFAIYDVVRLHRIEHVRSSRILVDHVGPMKDTNKKSPPRPGCPIQSTKSFSYLMLLWKWRSDFVPVGLICTTLAKLAGFTKAETRDTYSVGSVSWPDIMLS